MKSVLKKTNCSLILALLIQHLSYAQPMHKAVLRFKPEINNKASRLGDVLLIENDRLHWSNLPLESHPSSDEIITKAKILAWMTQQLGPFDSSWLGKTEIQVKPFNQASGPLLVEKAKAALIDQLGTHYLRVELTPLSHPKNSPYTVDDLKVDVALSFPIQKRVCVWLVHENKTRIAIWFKVNAYANVLVANRDMHQNTLIQSDAFSLKERNIAGLNAAPALIIPEQAWLKSSIKNGSILLASQIKKPPLVVHGQHIKIATHNHHITIVMDAIALEDGYLGDVIRVKHPLNQQTFIARISGFQQAEMTS